jgi:hypothetical protein
VHPVPEQGGGGGRTLITPVSPGGTPEPRAKVNVTPFVPFATNCPPDWSATVEGVGVGEGVGKTTGAEDDPPPHPAASAAHNRASNGANDPVRFIATIVGAAALSR